MVSYLPKTMWPVMWLAALAGSALPATEPPANAGRSVCDTAELTACAPGHTDLVLQLGSGSLERGMQGTVLMQLDHGKMSRLAQQPGEEELEEPSVRPSELSTCHTTTSGELCYSHVAWAKETGILLHPDWYPGLSSSSTLEEFQAMLHSRGDHDCPRPCGTVDAEPGIVRQDGALVPEGGEVRFYVVGSSNVAWETWPDQVNAMLTRLGYIVPAADFTLASMKKPSRAPVCDDATEYADLDTPRVGRVGWASWGFAYESKEDCDERGFRRIVGHNVSCSNAWACDNFGMAPERLVRPSEVAEEAQNSHVVILSNWVNDHKQRYSQHKCYDGEQLNYADTADITAENLLLLIRAIHARNPSALVLIMGNYPEAAGHHVNTGTLHWINATNAAVAARVVAVEPNTVFLSYDFPPDEEVFQSLSFGHPNCRGDRVMATAVVEALFQHRVLSKGLALGDPASCLGNSDCSSLSRSCCQRAALCYVATDGSCLPYGPGLQ